MHEPENCHPERSEGPMHLALLIFFKPPAQPWFFPPKCWIIKTSEVLSSEAEQP